MIKITLSLFIFFAFIMQDIFAESAVGRKTTKTESGSSTKTVTRSSTKTTWGPSLCGPRYAPTKKRKRSYTKSLSQKRKSKEEKEQYSERMKNKCQSNLNRIKRELASYSAKNCGEYPDDLTELSCRNAIYCPESNKKYQYDPDDDLSRIYCTHHTEKSNDDGYFKKYLTEKKR